MQDNGGYLAKNSPYQKISQAVGCELSKQLDWALKVDNNSLEQFWKQAFPICTVEMKGASQLLNHLHALDFHLGIISNGAEISRQKTLSSTSFGHLFKQLISSEKFGVSKPNVSIFTETAKAAGFKSSQCIYIGDHPIKDIQGAINAGMNAIWLQGFHADNDLPNDAIKVQSLTEIQQYLHTINWNE